METDRVTEARPIHLSFRSVQQVVVEPEDENRFMMTVKEAARACEAAQNEKDLRDQFTRMLVYLREWCGKRAQKVQTACVYPGDGFLNILIGTRGDDYCFDFDNEVTELDIELTRQFAWLTAEVFQVPDKAREGHISLGKAIFVYGDDSGTRTASGAQ
jgi:hypothetical protein